MGSAQLQTRIGGLGGAAWIAFIAAVSVAFSMALACAIPFAAIATIAGTRMPVVGAIVLTGAAWLANQLVGYLILGYPITWDSLAWGAMIGISALAATGVVVAVKNGAPSTFAALTGGFVAAFATYEAVLYGATAFLPSGDAAFSFAVVIGIAWTNILALTGLLVLHRLAIAIGLLAPLRPQPAGYA
ncbi:hypothetical protein C7450_101844 [Chelatococcus asaccharovorans]|uniref:Energy-coupling factor transport system substrate-specific component n=1 Tax=Chelatococcus asaccharovorans TaxID=28210 RepID=A0A2V3UIE5_9HYPH|nr:hypothetical protein C7450_101844 [Chelatococcus asaccharovorans]